MHRSISIHCTLILVNSGMSRTNSPNYGWIVYILIISCYFTAPALGSLYSDLAYDSLRESIINLKSNFAVVSSANEKYGHAIVKDVSPFVRFLTLYVRLNTTLFIHLP